MIMCRGVADSKANRNQVKKRWGALDSPRREVSAYVKDQLIRARGEALTGQQRRVGTSIRVRACRGQQGMRPARGVEPPQLNMHACRGLSRDEIEDMRGEVASHSAPVSSVSRHGSA